MLVEATLDGIVVIVGKIEFNRGRFRIITTVPQAIDAFLYSPSVPRNFI